MYKLWSYSYLDLYSSKNSFQQSWVLQSLIRDCSRKRVPVYSEQFLRYGFNYSIWQNRTALYPIVLLVMRCDVLPHFGDVNMFLDGLSLRFEMFIDTENPPKGSLYHRSQSYHWDRDKACCILTYSCPSTAFICSGCLVDYMHS